MTTCRQSCRQSGSPPATGRNSAEHRSDTSAGSGVRTLKAEVDRDRRARLGHAIGRAPEVHLDRVPGEALHRDLGDQGGAGGPWEPLRAFQEGGQRDPVRLAADLDRQLGRQRRLDRDPGPAPRRRTDLPTPVHQRPGLGPRRGPVALPNEHRTDDPAGRAQRHVHLGPRDQGHGSPSGPGRPAIGDHSTSTVIRDRRAAGAAVAPATRLAEARATRASHRAELAESRRSAPHADYQYPSDRRPDSAPGSHPCSPGRDASGPRRRSSGPVLSKIDRPVDPRTPAIPQKPDIPPHPPV